MIRRRWASLLALLLVAGTPELAHACAVCFDANDKTRLAFFATTVFMSLLPLGMIAGMFVWLRRRGRELRDLAAAEGGEPSQPLVSER